MSEDGILIEEVHAPNGGLVDTVNLDLLRGSEAQIMINMHHDRLALERRQGIVQIGNATPDVVCYGGYDYRMSQGYQKMVRVQGGNVTGSGPHAGAPTYLYQSNGANWTGAQSGSVAADPAQDVIGNGQENGNGCFVQYADKLYWYDAGTLHRLYDFFRISTYGLFAGATLPAGTATAGSGSGTGTAYSFTLDGSTYIRFGNVGITGCNDFTESIWFKTTTTAQSGVFWTFGDAGATFHRYGLGIQFGGSRSIAEFWEGGVYVYSGSNTIINDGGWNHLAAVRSGNQWTIFVNGGPVTTRTVPTTPTTVSEGYLGALRYSAGGLGNGAIAGKLTGAIDDARWYARALSNAEIVAMFIGQEISATGLKLWLKLDNDVLDSSGTGNHGTVFGTSTFSTDVPNVLVGGGGGSGGDLQAGTYSFVYTYYNPTTAEESPPSEVSNDVTFNIAGGVLVATVPANSAWTLASGFTTIRFYRTTVDGATYFFDHEIAITALPVTENLSRADETLGAEVQYTRGAIPRLLYAILFQEMIVGAGNPAEPSKLYWSAVGDPTHWPPESAQDIDKDNGDPITGIFRLLGRLYVLKETSGVYMLTPQFDSVGTVSFSVEAVTNDFGCLSHHSIAVIDTYAYWADAKGLCRFNGQQVENISDPKIRYKWKALASAKGIYTFSAASVNTALSRGYRAPAKMAYATHDRQPDHQYYRLTIEDESLGYRRADNVDTIDLIYDLSIGCWFTDNTVSSNRVSWLVKDLTGQYHVMQADKDGRAFRLRTTWDGQPSYTDAGTGIISTWRSKMWGGLDGVVPVYVEMEYERMVVGASVGPVTINLYADGQTTPRTTDAVALVPYASNSQAPTDSTQPDPTRITHSVRLDWAAEWCRRFCIEVSCDAVNTALRILQFRVGFIAVGKQLKAK